MKHLFLTTFLYFSFTLVNGQIVNIPLTATELYNGNSASGTLRVRYVTPNLLRRPLLVIEGFDPGHILYPERLFGETTIEDFILDINNIIPTPPATTTPLQDLLTGPVAQYDIVYLDWENGTDYIQRNALLAEEAIRWVNNQKALAGSVQPNVVIGQSMGGVVARYALRDMENKVGQNHQTRLFISHDAPQQGANVPQGFQHLARHARDLYIQSGPTAALTELVLISLNGFSPLRALSLANEPAAKQILINYVNDFNTIDNSVHNQWQTDLSNMGYPQGVAGIPFRRVSISNGSECATTEPFTPGSTLLSYQGKAKTTFLSDMGLSGVLLSTTGTLLNQPAFLLGTLPGRNEFTFDLAINSKASGTGNQVYKNKLTYTKKIMWLIPITVVITNRSYNAATATPPYDYYPGGYYDTRRSGNDLQSIGAINYFLKYNITVTSQPKFCFIPVTSSLDIGSGVVALNNTDYLARYSGGTPPLPPKNTPFQNFITATNFNNTENEEHISIQRRNGDWFAGELNATQPVANCSFVCSNAGIAISGSATICSTAVVYTLNNAPVGTTITWTASPTGIVNIAPIGGGIQATATRTGTGSVTLTANIFNNQCGSVNINSALIRAGGYSSGDYTISGPSSSCKNSYVYFSTNTLPGATGYTWFWPGDWTNSSGQGSPNLSIRTSLSSGQVGVRVANACDAGGSPGLKFVNVNTSCGSSFSVSPNPATDDVMVTTTDPQEGALAKTTISSTKIYKLKITDQSGNIKKQYSYTAGNKLVTINVSNLMAGIYTLQIFDGKGWAAQKLIKQ